jgi:chromate reductase
MPRVAVVNGSLRRDSINRRLALALINLATPRLALQLVQIDDLPIFNQDLEGSLPAAAARVKSEVKAADAVLLITPEHNRSISAAMKNVIDWCTRPFGTTVLNGKPAAIAGASAGALGAAVAQAHLRSVLSAAGMVLMGRPELHIAFKENMIDSEGNTNDELTQKLLTSYIENLDAWIARVSER